MKNILKFIYNKEDKGIYRIRTIFGIKITTKPIKFKLLENQEAMLFNFNTCFKDLNKSIILSKFYNKNIENNPNVAVFGALPPKKSGLSNYNAKTFGINELFTVFSDFGSFKDFIISEKYLTNNYKNNFFPIEYFYKYNNKYKKKIFVLGNSHHNVPYLKYTVEIEDKENSYLYLHEANQLFLIYSYLKGSVTNFKETIIKSYPNLYKDIKKLKEVIEISIVLQKNNIYGIKILLSLTNIKNIIVNNDKCEELILNEIKGTEYENKINIIKMFHPIEKLDNIKNDIFIKNNSYNYIGTFGVLDDYYKSTDVIIKSINILNKKYNKKIKLVLSGYNAIDYINTIKDKTLTENIINFETEKTEDFLSLINSVDIAVQLRNSPHGESSGVICQLLALNKKIITTKNFVSKELIHSVREVKPFINAEELALEILDYLEDKNIIDNSELVEKYSFENLANKLLEL